MLGSRLLYFHLALTSICFRSVPRYFLKSEYGVSRDCPYSESLWAGRSWGAEECDVTGVKLLSTSKYPQRAERINAFLAKGVRSHLCPGSALEVLWAREEAWGREEPCWQLV